MSATPDTQRRRFLKVLGGGTIAAAGAAVVVSQTAQATAEDNADASSASVTQRLPAITGRQSTCVLSMTLYATDTQEILLCV